MVPGRWHRAGAIGLAVALGVTLSSLSAAQPAPTAAKRGEADGTGSATQVAGGDAVSWVVDIGNDGDLPATLRVTDTIGAGQRLAPGSVESPPGWQVEYSDAGPDGPWDGAGGTSTEAVRATSPLTPPGGRGGASELPEPSRNASTAQTGGDGWIPIVHEDRVFNVFHHSGAGEADLTCSQRSDGTTCAGYPKDLSVYAAGDLYTPGSLRALVDEQHRLWIPAAVDRPASTNDEAGLFCFDLLTDAPCPTKWFPLGNVRVGAGAADISRAPVGGLSRVGDHLLMLGVRSTSGTSAVQSLCFDLASTSSCGVKDLNTVGLPAWDYAVTSEGRAAWVHTQTAGTRSYFTVDYGSTETLLPFDAFGTRIFCTEADGAPCAGWTVPPVPGTDGSELLRFVSALMENPDVPGSACIMVAVVDPVAIFANDSGPALVPRLKSRNIHCFDSTGALAPGQIPPGLAAMVAAAPMKVSAGYSFEQPVYFSAEEVRTLTSTLLLPLSVGSPRAQNANKVNSWAMCYDPATDGPCQGFGSGGLASFPQVNKGGLSLYGFERDEAGCIWGLGDQGWLLTLDPATGSTPCLRVASTIEVPVPLQYYCASEPVLAWQRARLRGIDAAELEDFHLTVLESGTPVPGFEDVSTTGDEIDLAGLSPTAAYTFVATVNATGTDSWGDGVPTVEVTFSEPDPQLCLRTSVELACPVPSQIVNLAVVEATDADGHDSSSAMAHLDLVGAVPDCPTTTTTTEPTTTTTEPTTTTTEPTTTTTESTTTTTESTTTTTESTTTTTESTTTTTESTTTTTEPTTTTTESTTTTGSTTSTTESTTTTTGNTTATGSTSTTTTSGPAVTSTSAPAATVAGTQTSAAAAATPTETDSEDADLALTGGNTFVLLLIGGCAVLLGSLLLLGNPLRPQRR